MNHQTKNKIIVYLATIFLVGGITGGVLGWTGATHKILEPPSPKKMCEHTRDRLKSELNLTADQMRKIDPILEKRAEGMEAIHSRAIKEIEELIRVSNEEIVGRLDESQRAKFSELEKKRQEFIRSRFKPRAEPFRPRNDGSKGPEGPP